MHKVAVIGAGVAGVTAAITLQKNGLYSNVFDKGRNIGGRCSTRSGEYTFNHGAPFFTANDSKFAAIVERQIKIGNVRPWHGRFAIPTTSEVSLNGRSNYYIGVTGMRGFVEGLGDNINILTSSEIASIKKCANGWRLKNIDGYDVGEYSAVILAMPPEQTRRVLPSNSTIFPKIAEFKSEPRWAVMATFEKSLSTNFDYMELEHPMLKTLVKQPSELSNPGEENWVIYSNTHWATKNINANRDDVAKEMLGAFKKIIGGHFREPRYVRAHRWRLALPSMNCSKDSFWDDELLIGVCGDWCVAPTIEGAFLSGLACGNEIAENLKMAVV